MGSNAEAEVVQCFRHILRYIWTYAGEEAIGDRGGEGLGEVQTRSVERPDNWMADK